MDQDQDLNYRVKLDTTDLASQLQQVRSQIDQAVGSIAYNSTAQTSYASPFNFPLQDYLRNAGVAVANDTASMVNAGQMATGHTANFLDASRLGFQKFNNDVQTALLTNTQNIVNTANGGFYPDSSRQGFFSNILSSTLGLGFKPTYGITPGEYSRLSGYQAAEQSVRFGAETVGGFTGGAIGTFFGGPLGGIAGGFIGNAVGGFADDAAQATILRDFTYGQKMKEFAYNSSWRFLGGRFTRNEAQQIGTNLAPIAREDALLGYQVTSGDASKLISEFTAIGGFDTVRSADEYQTRAKSMIENTRKIMQVLRTTQDDALRVIKEFTDLKPGSDIGALTMQTAVSAYMSGLNGSEMIQFAKQSAEMVRGTGISMYSAFMGGMGTLERVHEGRASGAISNEAILQAGGEQNYAANLERVGYTWGQSMQGYTQVAAGLALGGIDKTVGLSPTQVLGTATGYLTGMGVQGMLELSGNMPNILSTMSPMELAAFSALNLSKEMNMAGITPTRAAYVGLAYTRGQSPTEAGAAWDLAYHGGYRTGFDRQKAWGAATHIGENAAQGRLAIMEDIVENAISSDTNNSFFGKAARGLSTGVENFLISSERTDLARAGIHRFEINSSVVDTKGFNKMPNDRIDSLLDSLKSYDDMGRNDKFLLSQDLERKLKTDTGANAQEDYIRLGVLNNLVRDKQGNITRAAVRSYLNTREKVVVQKMDVPDPSNNGTITSARWKKIMDRNETYAAQQEKELFSWGTPPDNKGGAADSYAYMAGHALGYIDIAATYLGQQFVNIPREMTGLWGKAGNEKERQIAIATNAATADELAAYKKTQAGTDALDKISQEMHRMVGQASASGGFKSASEAISAMGAESNSKIAADISEMLKRMSTVGINVNTHTERVK